MDSTKKCSYCGFDNPPETLTCVSCHQSIEHFCPSCQSTKIVRDNNLGGYQCLDCHHTFSTDDLHPELENQRQQFDQKLASNTENFIKTVQSGQKMSTSEAFGALGQIFSPIKDAVVDQIKIQNTDYQAQTNPKVAVKAQVYSLKRQLINKVLNSIMAAIALACGLITYLLGFGVNAAIIVAIIAIIFMVIFIYPKYKKKYYLPDK